MIQIIQKQLEEERVLALGISKTEGESEIESEKEPVEESVPVKPVEAQVQKGASPVKADNRTESAGGAGGSGAKNNWVAVQVTEVKNEAPFPGFNSDEIVEVAIALYDYAHPDKANKDFFSFAAGDKFYILPSGPELQGWKIAKNIRGEKGFVPGNYLQVLPDSQNIIRQESSKPHPASASKPKDSVVQEKGFSNSGSIANPANKGQNNSMDLKKPASKESIPVAKLASSKGPPPKVEKKDKKNPKPDKAAKPPKTGKKGGFVK